LSRRAPRHLIAPQVILPSRIQLAALQDVSPRPYLIPQALVGLVAPQFVSPRPLSFCHAPSRLAEPYPIHSAPICLTAPQVVSPRSGLSHCAMIILQRSNSSRRARFRPPHPHPYSSMNSQFAALHFAAPRPLSSRRACIRTAGHIFNSPGPQLIARALFVSSHCSPSHRTVLGLVVPQVVSPCLDSIYRAPDGLAARQFASPDPTSSRRALGRLAALGSVQPHSNPPCHAPGRLVAPQGSSLPQVILPSRIHLATLQDVSPRPYLIPQALVRFVAPQFVSPRPLSSRRALGCLTAP
jgi:hypothetical protein